MLILTFAVSFAALYLFSCTPTHSIEFTHHVVSNPLPGTEWGTGGFTLADYDRDGDLDVTIQCRSDDDKVYWYEYQGADKWIPHFIGRGQEYQLGGTSYDVNRDGHTDLVMGHVWFQNPGDLKSNPDSEWEMYPYNGDMPEENHDIVTADINNDGIADIIMYNQEASTLRWAPERSNAPGFPRLLFMKTILAGTMLLSGM